MRDRLFALLEAGPASVATLADWLREEPITVSRALRSLAAEGLAVRLDDGQTITWALTGVPVPYPPAAKRRGRPPLRQPHDRQASEPAPSTSTSWWLGRTREEFTAALADKARRQDWGKFGKIPGGNLAVGE